MTKRPAPISNIEDEKHLADKVLSDRKKGTGSQFLLLMTGDPHYDDV